MNWTLEVVVVPVSDVDRAKAFYVEHLGARFPAQHGYAGRTVRRTVRWPRIRLRESPTHD